MTTPVKTRWRSDGLMEIVVDAATATKLYNAVFARYNNHELDVFMSSLAHTLNTPRE